MPDELIELLGAAGGDINGAKQEFKVGDSVAGYDHKLFDKKAGNYKHDATDDTFMTWAVAEGVIESYGKSEQEIELAVTKQMKEYAAVYPDGFPGGYGYSFEPWVKNRYDYSRTPAHPVYGGSCGDGSAMRIASVGALFDSLEETIRIAGLTALGSHWDAEGIKGAQALAAAGYLARAGVDKKDIKAFLETRFGYNLDPSVIQYRYYTKNDINSQSELCPTTVPLALAAFLEGNSYEECIRNTVFIGGDTDTIGAMVGGLAAAYYGIPKWLKKDITNKLDKNLQTKLEGFQKFAKTINRKPNVAEIETALAKARLEKHALEQFKANPEYAPNKDPKYFELLAEMEATRLFYDEVNRPDLKDKEDIRQALSDGKKAFVAQLKENLMNNSAELKNAYESSVTSLAKTVEVYDYDSKPRKKSTPRAWTVFPETRAVIDRDRVPGKIVESSEFARMLVDDGIKKLEDTKMQLPASDGSKDNEALDVILGEISQYYSSGKMPEQLADVLSDIKNMREATYKFDPDTLRDKAFNKLQKFSNELVLSTDLQNSADSMKQIALVNRLAAAVKAMPSVPLTEEQYKADKEAAEKEAKEVAKTKLEEYEKYRAIKDAERAAERAANAESKGLDPYYAKNADRIVGLKNKLERRKTFTNSSEYKKIIEALGDMGNPLSDKNISKNLDQRQIYAAKLFRTKELVEKYIKHKAEDGVKKNVFHKLAAVEELDEFLTAQIKSLGLKDKFTCGKKTFDPAVVEMPQTKPSYENKTIIEAYNSAKDRYKITAGQAETARALYCMDKIISKAGQKQIKDLKNMQSYFLECPGTEEMPTREQMAKAAAESIKKAEQSRSMSEEKIKLFNSALENNVADGYLLDISSKRQKLYQFAMAKGLKGKVDFGSKGTKELSASSLNSAAKSAAKKSIDAAEHPEKYEMADEAKYFAQHVSNDIRALSKAAYSYVYDNYEKDMQTLSNLKLNDMELVEKWPEISFNYEIYRDCIGKESENYPKYKGLIDKYEGFEKRMQNLAAYNVKEVETNEAQKDNVGIVK